MKKKKPDVAHELKYRRTQRPATMDIGIFVSNEEL